jgi:hypothetical protein
MVQARMLTAVAIDNVYAAYRENQSVTNILRLTQRDKARGGHPQLIIYYSFILLFSIIFIFILTLFLIFSRLLLYFIEKIRWRQQATTMTATTTTSVDNDERCNNQRAAQPWYSLFSIFFFSIDSIVFICSSSLHELLSLSLAIFMFSSYDLATYEKCEGRATCTNVCTLG